MAGKKRSSRPQRSSSSTTETSPPPPETPNLSVFSQLRSAISASTNKLVNIESAVEFQSWYHRIRDLPERFKPFPSHMEYILSNNAFLNQWEMLNLKESDILQCILDNSNDSGQRRKLLLQAGYWLMICLRLLSLAFLSFEEKFLTDMSETFWVREGLNAQESDDGTTTNTKKRRKVSATLKNEHAGIMLMLSARIFWGGRLNQSATVDYDWIATMSYCWSASMKMLPFVENFATIPSHTDSDNPPQLEAPPWKYTKMTEFQWLNYKGLVCDLMAFVQESPSNLVKFWHEVEVLTTNKDVLITFLENQTAGGKLAFMLKRMTVQLLQWTPKMWGMRFFEGGVPIRTRYDWNRGSNPENSGEVSALIHRYFAEPVEFPHMFTTPQWDSILYAVEQRLPDIREKRAAAAAAAARAASAQQ